MTDAIETAKQLADWMRYRPRQLHCFCGFRCWTWERYVEHVMGHRR